MSKISTISACSAAAALFGLFFTAGSFEAEAGAGNPLRNAYLSSPAACAALLSGTPGYRDCAAVHTPGKMKTIKSETQLKAEPNSSSKAVGILNPGTKVALLERTKNGFWCHVQSGGITGYVPMEALN